MSVSAFEVILHNATKIPTRDLKNAVDIAQNGTLDEFLDYCIEKNCFNDNSANVLYGFIVEYESVDSDYWEPNNEKLLQLYDAVGVTQDIFDKYAE